MTRRSAQERVAQARKLQSVDEARKLYSEWAADYDADIDDELKFTGGTDIAKLLAHWLSDRTARVIDLGCGTGLVGVELQKLGFGNIDGLDLSPEMLEVAKSKNVYQQLIEADLLKSLDLADDAYDAAISAGTFTTGHVNALRFSEFLRIIRPGGLLVCVVASDFWASGGFEPATERLQSKGLITSFQYTIQPISDTGDTNGYFCLAIVG